VVASLAPIAPRRMARGFQSPSLRGSGRFTLVVAAALAVWRAFQSPSLRGSGRFATLAVWRAWAAESFNPLHCGAVVASHGLDVRRAEHGALVSIPFIAGQWSLRVDARRRRTGDHGVSIPFIAGQWSLPLAWCLLRSRACGCFNPLHCGAVVASGSSPIVSSRHA